MLALLGLKDSEMRHRPAGDAKAPDATNYDESKADVFPQIPDPMLLKSGQRVTTPQQWWSARRPEIIADFEREILGKAPADVYKRQGPARWMNDAVPAASARCHRSTNSRQRVSPCFACAKTSSGSRSRKRMRIAR